MIFHSHILRSVKWVVLLVVLLFVSCDKKDDNPYSNLSLDYYAPMREKAFAVDAPGARMCIEAGKIAASKGLAIVAGT